MNTTRSLVPAILTAAITACGAPPEVPLYDDLGTFSRTVTSTAPEAQRYFDQGLRLTYAFNHAEAVRAFRYAAELDTTCAMCWWGMALALGPNINWPMDSAAEVRAVEAVRRASARAAGATPVEQALIAALAVRYGEPAGAGRASRDSAYAAAIRDVAALFPDDADAGVLASDAAMNLSPWNYWNPDGSPRQGTAELLTRLERVVAAFPDHPGACHFYIHAVEPVEPARALSCAERLAELMPGAGHLVHMPAHIYMRLGRFDKAVEHNVHGVEADEAYLREQRPGGVYPTLYYPHNWHFLSVAASMAGRSAEAIAAGRRTAAALTAATMREVPPVELYAPAALVMLARFARWQEILSEPAPPADLRYVTGMWHYVRGLAFAEGGMSDSARIEYDSLGAIAAAMPAGAVVGLNSTQVLLTIASRVLGSSLAAQAGHTDEAVRLLTQAVALQDGLTYDEPPAWYYPVRESLGAVLLRANRAAQAEAVFREDLRRNPGNGWSLFGLAQALRPQGKAAAADSANQAYRRAWARADTRLGGSSR